MRRIFDHAVGHIHALDGSTAYRGSSWSGRSGMLLCSATERGDAAAIGRAANRIARLQRDVFGAGHVCSFVYGDAVPHLHVHLAPR